MKTAGADSFEVDIRVDTADMFPACDRPLKLHWVSALMMMTMMIPFVVDLVLNWIVCAIWLEFRFGIEQRRSIWLEFECSFVFQFVHSCSYSISS